MNAHRPALYSYGRSTAAYRVRIALNLKDIAYDLRVVDLVSGGGDQHRPQYRALNPTGLVPTLEIDGQVLTQSLAICEYLDERCIDKKGPGLPLLPVDAGERAWVRALALDVACDIHPINNLRIQQYLKRELGADDDGAWQWMDHWMKVGFAGIEIQLNVTPDSPFCLSSTPGLADIFLVAQVTA